MNLLGLHLRQQLLIVAFCLWMITSNSAMQHCLPRCWGSQDQLESACKESKDRQTQEILEEETSKPIVEKFQKDEEELPQSHGKEVSGQLMSDSEGKVDLVTTEQSEETSLEDVMEAWEQGQSVTVKEVWSALKAHSPQQQNKKPAYKSTNLSAEQLSYVKSIEIEIFLSKSWSQLIQGHCATLPERGPSPPADSAKWAWELVNKAVVKQVTMDSIENIVIHSDDYETMLRNYIIEQCDSHITIDPFFDRQDLETFVLQHPKLQNISGLAKGMSSESWKNLELGYLRRYLSFYEFFPFHRQDDGSLVVHRLKELLNNMESGLPFTPDVWKGSAFGNQSDIRLTDKDTLDSYLFYHIYLYQAFRYCQKYLSDMVTFDDNLIKKIEVFENLYKEAQALVQFWKILTHSESVMNYKLKSAPLSRFFLFQNKFIPILLSREKSISKSYVEYLNPPRVVEAHSLNVETRMINIWYDSGDLQSIKNNLKEKLEEIIKPFIALNWRVQIFRKKKEIVITIKNGIEHDNTQRKTQNRFIALLKDTLIQLSSVEYGNFIKMLNKTPKDIQSYIEMHSSELENFLNQ